MVRNYRPLRPWVRRAAALAPLLVLAGCLTTSTTEQYPNSTFQHTSEFNTAIDYLWDRLLFAGTAVFILVEAMMIYIIVKYRARPGQKEPRHVHGNTTLEILWTVIPALILVTIAIPTVRTIFRTQAKAVSSALQVEAVGHQWWWEFRYPQYTTRNAAGKLDTLVTANELYLPKGRTVNFALRTEDVLHSFWIPRLGGKRDLIANHTNYLWFTPVDSVIPVLNGQCMEYCGSSHANMKFRTFVVDTAQFASWVAGQLRPAALGAAPAPAATQAAVPALAARADSQGGDAALRVQTADRPATQAAQAGQGAAAVGTQGATGPGVRGAPSAGATTAVQPSAAGDAGYTFPHDQIPAYATPSTPVPADIRIDTSRPGNPARGEALLIKGGCIGCHMINGSRVAVGRLGPNLTHVGSRSTIAAAQFPNRTEYLARWLKNAPKMKPGVKMPVLGQGEEHPNTHERVKAPAGLTDQEIMDLVAYLQALK